jgi:DNA (cytosine-5)-methyltransferase 1
MMRLLKESREESPDKLPSVIVAENVKALKNLLPILENEYAKVGYRAHSQLYNSKYWGVPQNRERYFVVGIRDDLPDTFSFPEEQHEYIPRLYTVLNKEVDEKFYISDDKAQTIINEALKRLDSLGSVHATLTPDRVNKRQNGRRAKGENEEMFTLTAQDIHGIVQKREETDDEK